ncbi:hypothetical protein CERSUDRAFT_43484 [Gelatoporia subvermispora B]|uniref:Uncharacterized protein n=1 Tax=Ceriporiopsis subvermispora (strain B) TaxID=914234 RepID=M2RRC0_CERS8|nr:hypothetical protein CERSUDRAFT_43484 [Gelatoporia subvermispora B]
MAGGHSILVASQLSALYPPTQPILVQTSQKKSQQPPSNAASHFPQDHALYSTIFHAQATGTIVLRVIHGGRVLELVSLTDEVPALRFDFPAAILPHPAIMMHQSSELHVIVVTNIGSVYRIVIPVRDNLPLWQPQSQRRWYREYVIQSARPDTLGLVQVQGPECVVVSLPKGALLRLETTYTSENSADDLWKESKYHHHSFLDSITSFIPTLHGERPGASEIVSIASHAQPTDIVHAWTMSRSRSLRLWTARGGCVAERSLPAIFVGRSVGFPPGSNANSAKAAALLSPDPQKLLSVFTAANDDATFVLAFIPTEVSPTAGGYFQLFDTTNDTLQPVKSFESSGASIHCHLQDFMISDDTLYTLWDKQGQSMVERAKLRLDDTSEVGPWETSYYPQEAELTPAYLDELLLSPGSMPDKLFEAIMRPGMFSPLTLQTAINQYSDACRSLPPPHAPQLLNTYATVGEQIAAVVGCTVTLTRDLHTGAPQYSKYWNALKRDWEGFVARCREVERNARWPLAIGTGDSKIGIIIVERERVAALVGEEVPIRYQRLLSTSGQLDSSPESTILEILWTLRTKIGLRSLLALESRLVDIVHQDIAFPYADIVEDQAQRANIHDELDEGFKSWISGRLQAIGDTQSAVRHALDIIGGFDKEVKREEIEVELLVPPVSSEWTKAMTASYVSSSIHARYDLCLALMALLFFISADLQLWDPSLLAEIFVVFRGVAMLRYITRQPAGDRTTASSASDAANSDDDVVMKMHNMRVSLGHPGFTPTYSLVHRLVTQYGGRSPELPTSAHQFLDATGLLQSFSPAHATKLELLLCERLRLLGYREVAREMLAWLPRTPGVTYVMGRLWIDEGRCDDAAQVMESIAGSFGTDRALSFEDHEALAAVLPGAELFESEFGFHLHVAHLFKAVSMTTYEVSFSQLAVSAAPPDADTADIWHGIIRGLTDLGLFEDAYTALISNPYERLTRECISLLVYRMCEENAVERLMSLNFAGFADEVEDALSFKARNADPRVRPFYSRILYTWYTSRGDYRNAAHTMYLRARKFGTLLGDPAGFFNIAELQLEAYVLALNALALVDKRNAWIMMPVTAETGHERRKLSRHIPENKFSMGKRDAEIVDLSDMQYEYTLLLARVELIRRDPTLLSSGGLQLPPESIILRLGQRNCFDMAIASARILDVDMSDLFSHLTTQCLRLARNPDAVISEDTSDWLLTDKVSSWPGTPADRGWRYLRQSLDRHDSPETDFRYSKVTLETILGYDRLSPPPPWLVHALEATDTPRQARHPEYLIRTFLRFELLEAALEHTLAMMRTSDVRLAEDQPKTAAATWLPYTLIDQVLVEADTQNDPSPRGRVLQKELRTKISNRISRVQKFSQADR